MQSRSKPAQFESLPSTPFYAGMSLGGLATVLLGAVLPAISTRWQLTDAQAGSLFTAQFTASILGAIASSYYRRYCVVLGYAAIAIGLAVFSLNSYRSALVGLSLMGMGISGAVTATNVIFGTEYPEKRGPLLTRTNFFWGLGAVVAPQLVAIAERQNALRIFLLTVAAASLLLAGRFTPLLKKSELPLDRATKRVSPTMSAQIFLLFSVILFVYVGAETAIAGWIATYAHRFENLGVARSSLVVSAFWLAIVAGRAVLATLLLVLSEMWVLVGGIVAAMAGMLLLLRPHNATVALVAIVIAGLGCSPIFPLATARMLARVDRSRSSGWIFAISGAGGAVLPWLTGLLSEGSGSLRIAFVVPLVAMAVVLFGVLIENILPASLPASVSHSSKQFY
ncbi:fucose permease [Silvibacterium bohemicum]|uniref:Fucose permease n=1 Tax=Silvibacterium bohemicum TaxID=1577686 RepID=A0A841JQA3_9BACT|nr:MFS transporter [Silvibacterium bohemicum]MBB6143516.1 fucose permease [Silvibacterium bohemicum]